MKRLIASVLTAVLCAGVFAGCSGGETASNKAKEETAQTSSQTDKEESSVSSGGVPTDNVTLRVEWWGGDDRHEATLAAIKKFEKKYPYIKIKAEYAGFKGMQEKVNTQMAGHTAPDVVQINYDWLAPLSKNGKGFYDLNSLKDIIDLSQWDEDILQFGIRNDILNAIPISTTGRSFFYNKDTLKKVGVEAPKTWDDLIEVGKAFEKYNKEYYPMDFDTGSGFTSFYAVMAYEQQKTGKEFLTKEGKVGFSVDEFKDAFDFYKKMEDAHVTRTQKQIQNDAGKTPLYQTDQFISGKVAGMIEWSSSVGKFEKVLKEKNQSMVLGDLPVLPDAKMSGWFIKPSMLFAINGETKYPKQSALFLNWLLNNPEAAKTLGTTRGIPASKSAMSALLASDAGLKNSLSYQATEQINNCKPTLESPYMDNSELKQAYITAMQAISYGNATTQQAAQTLVESMNNTLEDIVE